MVNPLSPIMFFDFVTHYGGSTKSTVQLVRELQKLTNVVVIDPYGVCQAYLDDLKRQRTPYSILCPEASHSTIGGNPGSQRVWRVIRSAPEFIRLIHRLRNRVLDINPCVIWSNSEKALFTLSRALGNRIPFTIYVRGEMLDKKKYVIRDWKKLTLVVCNSRKALKDLQVCSFPSRIEVVHSGIDVASTIQQSLQDPGYLPGPEKPLRVVMPASLIPLKNHAMAIKGLAKYCQNGGQAHLWICGDIPNSAPSHFVDYLKQIPYQLGIDNCVHFLGWRNDLLAVMARADIMALTSNTEGLPRSILEAMALAKPVLVSNVGGVSELVRDHIDGILIRRDDVNAFALGLHVLSDPFLRERLGQCARHRVQEQFSIVGQAHRFYNLLKEIVRSEPNV